VGSVKQLSSSFHRIAPFAPRKGTPLLLDVYILLAIDPGVHTGWAVFDEVSLLGCGAGDPPVERAKSVVIELPQVYPSHPVPPNDLVTLAFMAGRYVARAAEAFTVFPHQWKGNLKKDVCAVRVRSHLSAKEREIVGRCGVTESQMHNTMDAIGVGLFSRGVRI
jgi:hypothetical protein